MEKDVQTSNPQDSKDKLDVYSQEIKRAAISLPFTAGIINAAANLLTDKRLYFTFGGYLKAFAFCSIIYVCIRTAEHYKK